MYPIAFVESSSFAASGILAFLTPTKALLGTDLRAFGVWRWSLAPACSGTVFVPSYDTGTYASAAQVQNLRVSSVDVSSCEVPGLSIVDFKLPDLVSQPALADTSGRITQPTALCVTNWSEAAACSVYLCKADIDFRHNRTKFTTDMVRRLCGLFKTRGTAQVREFSNNTLTYPVPSAAKAEASILNTGDKYCDRGPCIWPILPNGAPQNNVCSYTAVSHDNEALTDKCILGAADVESGLTCSALRCDPALSLQVTKETYQAATGTFCKPYQDYRQTISNRFEEVCFTSGRGPSQQVGYPTGRGTPEQPLVTVSLNSLIMFGSVRPPPAQQSLTSCMCAGAADAETCETGARVPRTSENTLCGKWCAGNIDRCTVKTAAYCGGVNDQDVPECACFNAATTNFPGVNGLSYLGFVNSLALEFAEATPVAVGPMHCWWLPCINSITPTDARGAFLPSPAATNPSSCPPSSKLCAINLTNSSILRSAHLENGTVATRQSLINVSQSLVQDCSICLPPPDTPTPVRPAGCDTLLPICSCRGVDAAACATENTAPADCKTTVDIWTVTVHNLGSQVARVDGATAGKATVNPGDIRVLNAVGEPLPGDRLSVSVEGADPISVAMVSLATFESVLSDNQQVCLATFNASAVIVVGDPQAAQYHAEVTKCTSQTCLKLPPVPEQGGVTTQVSVNFVNYSSVSSSLQVGDSDAFIAQAGGELNLGLLPVGGNRTVLINGGTVNGGLQVSAQFEPFVTTEQRGTLVWASLLAADGTAHAVAAAFNTVTQASMYISDLNAATTSLPLPVPPGGGSTRVSFNIVNYTRILVTVTINGSDVYSIPTLGEFTWKGAGLTSIIVNEVPLALPPSTLLNAAVTAVPGTLAAFAAAAFQGNEAALGIYSDNATAQGYVDLVIAQNRVVFPPAPKQLKPLPGPETNGKGTTTQKDTKIVLYATAVAIALFLIGGAVLLALSQKKKKGRGKGAAQP